MAALSRIPFYAGANPCRSLLQRGTLAWLLAYFTWELFPEDLFLGWRGQSGRGRMAWPARVLLALALLRWDREGMSRRAALQEAFENVTWRAAMGLRLNDPLPSERTFRDFEHFLSRRSAHGSQRNIQHVFEHLARSCLTLGLVSPADAVWVADSTPMKPYGAIRDTLGLLGEGLRGIARRFGAATQTSREVVAQTLALPLPLLTAPSVKGAFPIEWRDPKARAGVLDQLAQAAQGCIRQVRRQIPHLARSARKGLAQATRHLKRVVRQDFDTNEAGQMTLSRRTTDRLVSITDPQARRFYKSRTQPVDGFKVHALGEIRSQLIVSVAVTGGTVHDGAPAKALIRRAKAVVPWLTRMLGDGAYGKARLRRQVREDLDVEVLAPPTAARAPKADRYRKSDFALDFTAQTATCPQGMNTTDAVPTQQGGEPTVTFRWSQATCQGCPARAMCRPGKTVGKRLQLHPEEEELRNSRAAWAQPELRAAYRKRIQGERLMRCLTRHGARQARAWGLKSAERQAYLIAMVNNLKQLARHLQARPTESLLSELL